MPSLRFQLFNAILQNRHLLQGKLRKEDGAEWETSLPEVRQRAARAAKMLGKVPKGLEVSPLSLGGVAAEWIRPIGASMDRVLLYFHGGGYVLGDIQAHRGIVGKFVTGSGIGAALFEYRLAPEHPFPAALDDALAAYEGLLATGVSPSRIAFAGDSAGGGLLVATMLAARDRGLPLPAAAVALSPWVDQTCASESYRANADACLSPRGSWTACANHYAKGRDLTEPYISPLYGDLAGLPSLLLFAGGNEVMRDDVVRFAEKAKEAGVDATLRVGPGMFHCYPACAPIFPEATAAMREISEFLKARLGD